MTKNPWASKVDVKKQVVGMGLLEDVMNKHPILNYRKVSANENKSNFLELVEKLEERDEEYQKKRVESELNRVLSKNAEFVLEEKIKDKAKILGRLTEFIDSAAGLTDILSKEASDPLKPKNKFENNSFFLIPFEKRKPFLNLIERLKVQDPENIPSLDKKITAFIERAQLLEKGLLNREAEIANALSDIENL